jgi:hypothetical protein
VVRRAELTLDLVVVGDAARDERHGGHRRARVRLTGRRVHDRSALHGTALGRHVVATSDLRVVVDERAARAVDGAAHHRGRLRRARVGEAAAGARDGAAVGRAVVRRAVLALDAVVVGNAAGDLPAS